MIGPRLMFQRALTLATLLSKGWANDLASTLADLAGLSDAELMKGTSGGKAPAVYQRCPVACSTRSTASEWTIYSDVQRLRACDQPLLFDFAIANPLNDPDTTTKLRVCTVDKPAGNSSTQSRSEFAESVIDVNLVQSNGLQSTTISQGSHGLLSTLQLLHDGFQHDYNETLPNIMFSYQNNMIAAIYAGKSFDKGTIPSLISRLEILPSISSGATVIAQLCGGFRDADSTLGAAMSTLDNMSLLQDIVKRWLDGDCAILPGIPASNTSFWVKVWESINPPNGTLPGPRNSTRLGSRFLPKRADKPQKNSDGSCFSYTTVKGDDCSKLAHL